MSKKLVAIGGGENGRLRSDGTRVPYETEKIDREIVRLTGKMSPNFLFLGHAQKTPELENRYFETMKYIYGEKLGCKCDTITLDELKNGADIIDKIEWADIIYEGGGDTLSMVNTWRNTGFDKVLKSAWENGKIICGISAGANCWFSLCSSDSLKIQLNDPTAPLITVECLGWFDLLFVPHCNVVKEYTNRLQHMKEALKENDMIGIGISNCCALEIIDDKYRIICSSDSAYVIKAYWKNKEYREEYFDKTEDFKDITGLLEKNKM